MLKMLYSAGKTRRLSLIGHFELECEQLIGVLDETFNAICLGENRIDAEFINPKHEWIAIHNIIPSDRIAYMLAAISSAFSICVSVPSRNASTDNLTGMLGETPLLSIMLPCHVR
jgi:hypothetical protein